VNPEPVNAYRYFNRNVKGAAYFVKLNKALNFVTSRAMLDFALLSVRFFGGRDDRDIFGEARTNRVEYPTHIPGKKRYPVE
jgi:hypothetical protein